MKNIFTALIIGLISLFILGTIPAAACVAPLYDYGDAPDSYIGASHVITGLYLGGGVEEDYSDQPSVPANIDDDDGILFTNIWVQGSYANIDVISSGTGFLNAWVDFNQNGDWADKGEQIFDDIDLIAGTNSFEFYIPETAALGDTYARFRLNSTGDLNFDGVAYDGEVEDYRVEISSPVPVPASLVLLGMGLLGFAGFGRRKINR